MKGTGAKCNVYPGSCVSTGAKFPVAPVESAPMPAHPGSPGQRAIKRVCVCGLNMLIADSSHGWFLGRVSLHSLKFN